MDSKQRRINDIYTELDKHDRLNHNELKRIVVDQEELMSSRPFEETLKQMWGSGVISRVPEEEGRRLVWYSTKIELMKTENKIVKYHDEKIKDLEKQYMFFKNQFKNLTTVEKANGLALLFQLVYIIKHNLRYYYLPWFSKNTKLKKQQKQLEEIEHQLFHLMDTKDPVLSGQIMTLTRDIFVDEEVKRFDDLFALLPHEPE